MISRPRALLVEDEETCFRTLFQLLQRWGYAVIPTIAWKPALEAIVENSLDIAIIDIELRCDYDGLRILDTIRKSAKHKDLPVVMISGIYPEDHEVVVDVTELRASFLAKPFTPEQLRQAIGEAKALISASPGEVSDYQIQTLPVMELPALDDLASVSGTWS